MPARVTANFGYAMVNPNGDKPISFDRFETFYTCINLNCGKVEDYALRKWNDQMNRLESK